MSSKSSKCSSIKFSYAKTNNKKIFNVEISQLRQKPKYKPRFYTNKNLFFVRNLQKNSSNLHKKKLKRNFLKNHRTALANRKLRNKHGLFITHRERKALNSLNDKSNNSQNHLVRIKKKIKFKFSVVDKQKSEEEIKNNCAVQSNTTKNNKTKQEEKNNNIMLCEELLENLYTNNTPVKKPKMITKNSKYSCGRWNLEEHKKFIEAIIKYGNNWKEVQRHIGTRSSSQARSHAQKFFIKLKQDQSKSKISKVIDYSNSSIKNFHDALQSLPPDKKENIIKELDQVVFDKQLQNKKRRRSSKNKGITYSETNTEIGFISGTDFFEDETFILGETEDKNINQENKKYTVLKRKMSIDSLKEEKMTEKRKFINEFENNNNGMFTEEEYEKSFHKVFSDKEGKEAEPTSRKQSIEDDFIFNINIQ